MTKTTKQKDDDYEGKGRRGRRRRRDVTKIRIDEGSYVDRPAQEPAIAVFLKRDGDPVSKVLPTPNEGESRSDESRDQPKKTSYENEHNSNDNRNDGNGEAGGSRERTLNAMGKT